MSINVKEKPISPGLPLCEGCVMELLVRTVIDVVGTDIVMFGGPSCLLLADRSSIQYYGSLMTNMASSASGVSRGLRRQGKDTTCVCIAGDGTTADIAFGCVSAAAERGERILYICYDNEAYMNTGIQRSSTTPIGAWTNTTPVGDTHRGKKNVPKPVPILIAEHGCAYTATLSPAYVNDMRLKIKKAKEAAKEGFAYLHFQATCPTGWKAPAEKAIEISRMAVETNYFPLWEAEYGEFRMTKEVANRKPITEFTKYMKRFAHMTAEEIDRLQNNIDNRYRYIKRLCKATKD